MSPADLVLLVAATTSLTRLMTHDTITAPLRNRVLAHGAERTVFNPERPDGDGWEPVANFDGLTAAWHRRGAWYARMLACPRFCAPVWAGTAIAALWLADAGPSRWPVVALGLRGLHATVWPLVADQFGES